MHLEVSSEQLRVFEQIHKKFDFFQKTLAFLYFMVYTREACDIDSYEARGCCEGCAGVPWSECQV